MNDDYKIIDKRTSKHFTVTTFSNYLKKEVISAFKKALINSKIDEACYWCCELIASLESKKCFEILLSFACKYIHTNNPFLPLKLYKRYKLYLDHNLSEEDCRNSQVVRNHLIELSVILSLSLKGKSLMLTSLKDSDFNMNTIFSKFTAKTNDMIYIAKSEDPKEIIIILNEFMDNLKKKNYEKSIYWLSWVLQYEKMNAKKKIKLTCYKRSIEGISDSYTHDLIWLIWELIINVSLDCLNKKIHEQIMYLYKLYKLNYKPSTKYKYIYLMVYSIKYFTYTYTIIQPLCMESHLSIKKCATVNLLFKDKKKYEKKGYIEITPLSNSKDKTNRNGINNSKMDLSSEKFKLLAYIDNKLQK